MALFRDPLDELIADLERTLPAETDRAPAEMNFARRWQNYELLGWQFYLHAVQHGTAEDVRRAEQDPRFQAFCGFGRQGRGTPAGSQEATASREDVGPSGEPTGGTRPRGRPLPDVVQ